MISSEMTMIGGLPVEVIRKSNLKNMYIRINPPEGNITVSAPVDATAEGVTTFVLRKMPEIVKVRGQMLAQPRQSKREYVSGEACYLWGKPYMLQVVFQGNRYRIEKTPNRIIMTAPIGATEANREKALTEWYRAELKRVLPSILRQCEDRIGVQANACSIKYMRTRWGSCNVEERRILINLQLVKKPLECLEYVVTHELIHLLEKNHTNRFRSLMDMYSPNWRDAKRLLEMMPLDHIEHGETETDE